MYANGAVHPKYFPPTHLVHSPNDVSVYYISAPYFTSVSALCRRRSDVSPSSPPCQPNQNKPKTAFICLMLCPATANRFKQTSQQIIYLLTHLINSSTYSAPFQRIVTNCCPHTNLRDKMSSSDDDTKVVDELAAVPSVVVAKDLPPSTYEIRPNLTNAFKGTFVKTIVNEVLHDTLRG